MDSSEFFDGELHVKNDDILLRSFDLEFVKSIHGAFP
jgi:hypothetical protein